jgi:hypothetical protein
MVTRTVEQISPVCRVDIEEDARDHDRLFFQQLLEEGETVAERIGKLREVEPDVERRLRLHFDFEPDFLEPFEDVVTFCFKVLLEGDLD